MNKKKLIPKLDISQEHFNDLKNGHNSKRKKVIIQKVRIIFSKLVNTPNHEIFCFRQWDILF